MSGVEVTVESESIPHMIERYSAVYGVDPVLLKQVAKCESGFRPTVYGDHGKAYGVYQFHRPTFDMFAKEFGQELDYFDPEDQIQLAAWSFSTGKASHWTCAKGLIN